MPYWERFTILGAVVLASLALARIVDLRMRRQRLEPGAETRYRILRRSIMSAIVKDFDTGLVDFPSVREGEDVLLCWQLGEDEVAFWHPVDSGFADRRPL